MNIAQRITIDPAAQSYVSQPRKILIDGEWVNAASGQTFPVYDPSTGAVLANVAGWLASFRILRQKPLEVLRGE